MKEFWLRRDKDDPWFGPLTFRDAASQARRMTMKGTPYNVLYAQIGTMLGSRPGDPKTLEPRMVVIRMYANGKAFLGGRIAEYNKDKLPFV